MGASIGHQTPQTAIHTPKVTQFSLSTFNVGNVSPIYKNKGSKSQPGNYRPVSLTSNVCKLMEKVVNKALSRQLERGVPVKQI